MKKIKPVQVDSATFTPAKRVKRKGRDLEAGCKNQFGVCPICRHTDGFLTLRWDHYFVCDEHKLRWYVGSNMLSALCSEFEDITIKNLELIKDYKDAKPVYFSLRDRFNPDFALQIGLFELAILTQILGEAEQTFKPLSPGRG